MAQQPPAIPGEVQDLFGEALAAVTGGLERVLAVPVKPLAPNAEKQATAFLKGLPALVKAALEGKGGDADRETPEGDYFALLSKLTDVKKRPAPEIRAALAQGVDTMFGVPYTMWFDRAFTAAAGLIPRRTWTTMMGPRAVEPSDSELGQWWRAWDVARNPMVAIQRMADGTLVTDEVEALKQFYPALRGKMLEHVFSGLADLATEHGEDWLPADSTQRAVETFTGFSALSQEFAAQLQDAARAAREGEAAKQEQGMVNGPVIDGPKLETPVQRVANR